MSRGCENETADVGCRGYRERVSREQQSWDADPYADLDWNPDEVAPPEDFDAPPPPEFDGYGAAVARATRDLSLIHI